jgi:SsrA-binding protein
VLETFEAGLRLKGTEVKSVREGRVQLKDSYVEFRDGQAFLVGAHISAYSHGNRENHDPEQVRKLLLRKREIERLFGRTQLKGLTVVPLSMYLKGNWIKVEIALVQGKKLYDKRESEKARELDREAEAVVNSGKW